MRIHITTRHIPLRRALRQFVQTQLAGVQALFSPGVTSIQVELRDRNGRRGGGDKECHIRVEMAEGGPVLARDMRANLRRAIRRAAACAASEVRSRLRGRGQLSVAH